MKQKLVNEIVKEYCLTPDILAHDYYYEWVKLKMKLTSSEDQALTTDVPTSYHGISEERSELHTSKPLQDLSLSASAVTSEPKAILLANSFATTFRPITLERPKGYMGLGRFIYFYW
ncbi:uncharacterized protein LOC133033623 isoform X3 [Cannabis sativa]|uniref:uncharacterized protein LOC133033623 isoform X3 n=1 Tax=Cannabis sativa TaxID=3483 RepID=UPI0029C9B877|nr:uncharacterized protein LOC133033623 isoform X3 [Cannabis sativa]